MSRAALLAGIAGALAGVGIVELIVLLSGRPRASRAVVLRVLARLGRRFGAADAPGDLRGRLVAAGSPFGLRVSDLMAIKGGAALLGLACALPLSALLPGRLALLVPVALPAATFLAPDLWLQRHARARGREMEIELPDLLDLLRVALAAGLPLERAIGDVARRASGLLAREWRTVAVQVELGVPRERALADLAQRCPAPGVAALVRTLDRAARHGAPLGEALTAQAAEARAAYARRLNEQAARAAPKIQLVVALLLVPSVLLLVGAALLTAFVA
ncbi:type II secretion system F family protein [Conexibacter sp. CPCC 206217]|uniref:type II secretion system F family protein n=1 Tax=Conexibacter sp. CPCC 206217 TaxID=3064574 RepID=UPI002719DA9E|nr:type II secretion system F family protein [Conexibacter sp. CPCC 206217]MDO8212698.1 type II secretion system F family protein [Conexibacter sp. CPCC 206217]